MILVTGGTGLVGSHLLLHLLENAKQPLRAIYRSESQIKRVASLFDWYSKSDLFNSINWIKADILDVPSLELAFENITHVYHCAAQISFDPKDENSLRKVNIEGTANIVNFCIDKKIQKLCHVSSIAALGDLIIPQSTINESTEWNPEIHHSDYAISKFGAEMEVWRGQQEGLNVVIVNPGIILGPYPKLWDKTKGSGALFNRIKKGMPFYTQGFTGFVSVWDVVKIMEKLMNSSIQGERYIVVAENRSFKDIIYTIAEAFKIKPPKFEAKKWMLILYWRWDQLSAFLFKSNRKITNVGIQSLCNKNLVDNSKIIKELNYTFEPINSYIRQIIATF